MKTVPRAGRCNNNNKSRIPNAAFSVDRMTAMELLPLIPHPPSYADSPI